MFHAFRATTASVSRDPVTFKKPITRNSSRRPGKGRSDKGPPKGTYVLGPDSDDDAGNDSRVVPQNVAPQRVKYTRLQDVLQEMIDRFSAIPLHVSALDSLAVLVYASQELDANSRDRDETFTTFDMFVNTLDANPTMILELQSAAKVVEQFETLCKTWGPNKQYLLEFFNNKMVQIKQRCNPTFLQEVQSNVQATNMLLRQDPTQELMPLGMEDTHKAVTDALQDNGQDPEKNELDVLKHNISVELNSANMTEIETVVSKAYKEFLERLKSLIDTGEIIFHENLGYKHEQWSINFDQHWKTINSGFKEKLDNVFSDAKNRDHMRDKIRTNVELIFNTILVCS